MIYALNPKNYTNYTNYIMKNKLLKKEYKKIFRNQILKLLNYKYLLNKIINLNFQK